MKIPPLMCVATLAQMPGLDLDVESLEAKLRFTLSSVLLIGSPGLMRDWPLRLLDPAALPALPTLPIGDARGSDWAAVRALIRQGAFSQDVYIASVDDSVGHGYGCRVSIKRPCLFAGCFRSTAWTRRAEACLLFSGKGGMLEYVQWLSVALLAAFYPNPTPTPP